MSILHQPLLVQNSSTVLGKRKALGHVTQLLSTTSLCKSSSPSPIAINRALQEPGQKRFQCTFEGCDKAYAKPSRLEEHKRSHTGEVWLWIQILHPLRFTSNKRPYTCNVCGNSYFRESHLAAHSRCHLPESSKPFSCSIGQCGKKFWTAQHLRVHMKWHDSPKPFLVRRSNYCLRQ
jgi:general transcription factor IIIA